jgi:hypothetical protein
MLANMRWYGWVALLAGLAAAATTHAQDAPSPPAQVAVSPSRFDLQIGSAPTLDSFRIINLGQDTIEVRISVSNWEMDLNNQVQEVAPTEQSLDQWMVVNPLHFSIPAGESQTVRFSIRPRVKPEPGEHRAIIYLNQVLPKDGAASGLRDRFRYGVVVYGQVGETVRHGIIHGVKVDTADQPLVASFDISSDGSANVRMSGRYAVWPAAAYPGCEQTTEQARGQELPAPVLHTGDLPALPILPATRRAMKLVIPIRLSPGDYVLDLNGVLGSEPINQGVPFSVPHPEPTPSS